MDNVEYQRLRYEERKAFAVHLLGGQCIICGVSTDLEFDHIDPSTKSFNITSALKADIDTLLNELQKCQLLCCVHHDSKTKVDYLSKRTHGSTFMATKVRCACDLCVARRDALNAERRFRRTGSSDKAVRSHGTYAMYKAGCREECCKAANREYMNARNRKTRADGVGGGTRA